MKRKHLIALLTMWLKTQKQDTHLRVVESSGEFGILFYVEDHFIEEGSFITFNPHFYTVLEAYLQNELDCKHKITWDNTKTTMHIRIDHQTSWITP